MKNAPTMIQSIRVLIADDNELVRRGIASLLASENGWKCAEKLQMPTKRLRKLTN